MGGAEQPRAQLQIDDRGSNPVSVNQFFLIGFTCPRSPFSFVNIQYFTRFISFDLILLWTSSDVFARLFLSKLTMKQK